MLFAVSLDKTSELTTAKLMSCDNYYCMRLQQGPYKLTMSLNSIKRWH